MKVCSNFFFLNFISSSLISTKNLPLYVVRLSFGEEKSVYDGGSERKGSRYHPRSPRTEMRKKKKRTKITIYHLIILICDDENEKTSITYCLKRFFFIFMKSVLRKFRWSYEYYTRDSVKIW